MTLDDLGWGPHFEAAFAPYRDRSLFPARVATKHRGGLELLGEDERVPAVAPRSVGERPAVGDWVAAARLSNEEKAVVEAVLPRRTAFTRSDPWSGAEEVVAANVDTVFVVTAVGRDFNPRRLERYLAAAHESGAEPVVLLNKADLEPGTASLDEARGVAPGVPVHLVSARKGAGLAQLEAYLGRGRTVALLGSSGVGKSTLANRLAGTELATGEVRGDELGRHTTTRRELVPLPGGGLLLDTPGLRELQLARADLDETFPEIAELAGGCRFRDCSHSHEPGCAVLAAVEAGDVPRERHESYLKLAAELAQRR